MGFILLISGTYLYACETKSKGDEN
jgi:hypothetical protein